MNNLRPISTPDQAPTFTVQTQRRLQIMEAHFEKMNQSTSQYEQRKYLDRIKTEAAMAKLDLGAWLKAQYFKRFMAESRYRTNSTSGRSRIICLRCLWRVIQESTGLERPSKKSIGHEDFENTASAQLLQYCSGGL